MTRHSQFLAPLLLVIIALALTTACDSEQALQAFVLDAETQFPIDSVSVNEAIRNKTVLSDSIGFINYYNIIGGVNPPDLQMTFIKPGFNVLEMTFPPFSNDTLIIELTPE